MMIKINMVWILQSMCIYQNLTSALKDKFLVVYYNLNMSFSSRNTHEFPAGGCIERWLAIENIMCFLEAKLM